MPFDPLFWSLNASSPWTWARGLTASVNEAAQKFVSGWSEFWSAFPNIFRMTDVAFRTVSGITGILISFPFEGTKAVVLDQIRLRKMHYRLIRVDDAVEAFFDTQIATVRQATFTAEHGVISWLIGWVAQWLYRFTKNVILLGKLIRAKSEAEFVEVVLKSFERKLRVFRAVFLVIGIVVFVLAYSFAVMTFSFSFNWGTFQERILPQDSRRIRSTRRNERHRLNLRKGPDL